MSKEHVLKVLSRGSKTRTQIIEELRGIVSERSILAAVTSLLVAGEIYQSDKKVGGARLSLKPFKTIEQRILETLSKGPMSCKGLARQLGEHNSVIHFRLADLKDRKMVKPSGNVHNRLWHLTQQVNPMNSIMSDEEVAQLRQLVAAQWRGTWLQGMEVVL